MEKTKSIALIQLNTYIIAINQFAQSPSVVQQKNQKLF